MKNIRAVGFDVDGTLYHAPDSMSLEVGKILIRRAAEELSRDPDELAEEYLKRRDELRSNTKTLNSFGLEGEKIFQEVWDGIEVERYIVRDEPLTRLIADLRREYRLFIITNGTGRQVERKLTRVGLNFKDFDPRIYCYDQGWIKPEPAPFLAAIEGLSLRPEEIVYVGDRVDMDIEGARAVGMKTILVGGESPLADESCERVYDIGSLLS